MRKTTFCVALLLGAATLATAGQQQEMKVYAQYHGTVENNKKPKIKTGFIANEADWKRVWEQIYPKEKTPKVDFTKHFLVFDTQDVADPNRRSVTIVKNEKGIVSVRAISTLIGFEPSNQTKYTFYVISREGVTGVQRYDADTRKMVIDPLPKK